MKVAIRGGGVAGSLLSYMLANSGHNVTIFDIKRSYIKPCGDIVPNVYTPPKQWDVNYEIKRFAFLVDGEKVYDVGYRSPKWLVIDKWGWINSMREKATQEVTIQPPSSKDYDVVVDSRGPYPMDRKVVYTTRAIIRTEKFDDTAVFEFSSKFTGFYWIFPSKEGEYNVGAGFLEYKNSRELLIDYMRDKFKEYKLLDIRGAPISLQIPNDKRGRIGEARGLVFPLSGEGIRPSAISAEKAFQAITHGKDITSYLDQELRRIEGRIRIQHILLNAYMSAKPSVRKMMMKTLMKNDVLIDAYLEDKIDLQGISESLRLMRGGGF